MTRIYSQITVAFLVLMVHGTVILLSFCLRRSRAPLDAYFQVSRTQPQLPTTSHGSETRNPVSEDLQVSSSSDSDSSTEYEEVVVQGEEPRAVVIEGEYVAQFWIHRANTQKARKSRLVM